MAQKNMRRVGKCGDASCAKIGGLFPKTVKLLVGGYELMYENGGDLSRLRTPEGPLRL
jgi:hypothetical protein